MTTIVLEDILQDNVRRVNVPVDLPCVQVDLQDRKSSMRSNRRPRKSSMRSNRRSRRTTRSPSRRMRGGMEPLPMRGFNSVPNFSKANEHRFSALTRTEGENWNNMVRQKRAMRSPSPAAPIRRLSMQEQMDAGLMVPDMRYRMNKAYEEIAPVIQSSVNKYVTPLINKASQDPTSTAILLAVIFGIIERYVSGNLRNTSDVLDDDMMNP